MMKSRREKGTRKKATLDLGDAYAATQFFPEEGSKKIELSEATQTNL